MDVRNYFIIFGMLQLAHSQEEIWTGFHKKWFLFKMPLWVFLLFEAALSLTILAYIFWPNLVGASVFMPWFIVAMLLNGIEHIVWAVVNKSYVPGLVTAPLFIILFFFYYASL